MKRKDPPPLDRRIQVVISEEELEKLDRWRQKHRVWSRSAAIREAIRLLISRKEN
jgi:metal-responsive CopG/Arc/MetJ family transcriptional regulator